MAYNIPSGCNIFDYVRNLINSLKKVPKILLLDMTMFVICLLTLKHEKTYKTQTFSHFVL